MMKTVVKAKFYRNGNYDGQEYTYLVPEKYEKHFQINDYAIVQSFYDNFSVVLITDVFSISEEELDKATVINGNKIKLKYVLYCVKKEDLDNMKLLNEA